MKPISDKLNRQSFINKKYKGVIFIPVGKSDTFFPIYGPNSSYYITYKNGKRHQPMDGDYPESEFTKLNN